MAQAQNNAYQRYLEARHAAFATPRPLVDAMVRRATSQPATSLARLVRGNDNEVYIATLSHAGFAPTVEEGQRRAIGPESPRQVRVAASSAAVS